MATLIFWPSQQTNQSRLTSVFFIRFWLNLVWELSKLFWIILVIFEYHFRLIRLFSCSCPHQTGSDHHHHPNFMTFFQSARAAFCGTCLKNMVKTVSYQKQSIFYGANSWIFHKKKQRQQQKQRLQHGRPRSSTHDFCRKKLVEIKMHPLVILANCIARLMA